MSRNPSGAAITRDDAAADESSPHAVTVPRQDLADLAAMLVRVEALVANDVTAEPNGSDSIERIADIAFVLHERDVEASLCDALDAAVREISAAGAGKEDRVRRARQAAEVLRELAQRVNAMIASSQVQRGEPLGTANKIESGLPQAAALRSESQPSRAPAAPASEPQRETDVVAAPPFGPVQRTKSLGGQGAAVNGADGAVKARPSAAAVMPPAEPVADAFPDEDLLQPTDASETAVSNRAALNDISSSGAPMLSATSPSPTSLSSTSLSSSGPAQSKEVPLLLNPEDDPGDLFEPAADTSPVEAPEPSTETAPPPPMPQNGLAPVPERGVVAWALPQGGDLGAESPVESSNPPRPLRFPAAAVPLSIPHPEPTDPLAPVRALSEEETIALFS